MNWDALFEEYMQAWCEANVGNMTAEEMEEKAPDLYEEWANAPCSELNGISPRAYFAQITSVEELVGMLKRECESGNSPSSLLLDRLVETDSSQALTELITLDCLPEIKITAVNLLRETGAQEPLAVYLDILAQPNSDEGLAEVCAEGLADCADEVKDGIFAKIAEFPTQRKIMAAEILLCAHKDERTYQLLVELFQSGENRPLIAGFMGKYGDERAASVLYPALDDCPYADYIEIRSAIEQLGGVVDDEYRDFSSDPTYKALKNIK